MNDLSESTPAPLDASARSESSEPSLHSEFVQPLLAGWRLLVAVPIAAGALTFAATFLVSPVYQSTTTFMPPQQRGGGSAALEQLSALAGVSAGAGARNVGDLYVSMMQSATISDRMIDRFKLLQVYDRQFRDQARLDLSKRVHMNLGKKDGLVTVDVEDHDPARAAAMANAYVDELRRMNSSLAVTEAQQRRMYFESQMDETRVRLDKAQVALEQSGFTVGSLKAEPRAAADTYARLQAQLTAAEVKLQALRSGLTDNASEVQQQLETVSALRSQVRDLERSDTNGTQQSGGEYVGKYRDFKYQETLLELFAKQYELARIDESRDNSLIQVIDVARPAEHRLRPKRTVTSVIVALLALFAYAAGLILSARRRSSSGPRQGGMKA